MEAVTNVVNAASAAIWGKQSNTDQADKRTANNETAGQEPLSGATGAGNADEPYDKGNAIPESTIARNETGGQEPLSGVQGTGTLLDPFDKGNAEPPAARETIDSATTNHQNANEAREKLADEESTVPGTATEDRPAFVVQEGGGELRKENGAGEGWARATGGPAEGDNSDATEPGAGKDEARILNEYGVEQPSSKDVTPETPAATGETSAGKPSKLHKLKDKLHIGTGKHI